MPSPATSPENQPSGPIPHRSAEGTIARLFAPLPAPLPGNINARLALIVMRRLGAHGLADARATQLMLEGFGAGFRRPLVLMRAFMAELAHGATQPITIAPCCCLGMTRAEATLLTVLAGANAHPARARLLLAEMTGNRTPDAALSCATAVSAAFADAGRPLSR